MAIIVDPQKIQRKSFAIIERYLGASGIPQSRRNIIRRVIHATADPSYAKRLLFSKTAVRDGINAIRNAKYIIADSAMVKAGINKTLVSRFNGKVICHIDDKDIKRISSRSHITRAILSMRKALRSMDAGIVAIGNAPTALFELCDLIEKGLARPALVIGVPIGFVGAKESKARLRTLKIPYITNAGRKGGSSVAASITNALLILAEKGKE